MPLKPTFSPGITTPATYFAGIARLIEQVPHAVVDRIVDTLVNTYEADRALYVFGNGGSAALASHVACDLGKNTSAQGLRRFRVLSLTDNVPLMTAWANDCGYESIFAEQLRHFIQPDDVSFAISCSGNSPNIVNALQASRECGGVNIGLTGFAGGKIKPLCDICLIVPSDNMQFIEDIHLAIMHSIFYAVCHRIAPRVASASTGFST